MKKGYIIVFLFVLTSCRYIDKTNFNVNNFNKLTLGSTGEWSQPGLVLELNSQKNIKLLIEINHDTLGGFYTGSISEVQYKEFCSLLDEISFNSEDSTINRIIADDMVSYDLIIVNKNGKKYHFKRYDKEELVLINFLLQLYKRNKLNRVDTLVFNDFHVLDLGYLIENRTSE